jgi:ABC-type phosphate/phosphonate transport system permease subunit
MYKLIGLILAAIPFVLLLRSVFTVRQKGRSQAVSNFRRQVDYLVWAILFLIGCEVVYLITTLVLS